MLKQDITSANTSIHKINRIYSNYTFPKGSMILDYGCGKYFQEVCDMMARQGIIAAGYDPYNQDDLLNDLSLSLFDIQSPDYIVCSNVLNVIKEDEVISDILNHMYNIADNKTKLIFNIYKGNSSGVGAITAKGYQRNELIKEYIPMISAMFNVDKVTGNIIECTKGAA